MASEIELKIVLDRSANTGEAFSAIGLSCLRQVMANRDAVAAGKAAGVHQMRVGLRRLHAAISTFNRFCRGWRQRPLRASLNG
jgi:CHAD domain-containing protein